MTDWNDADALKAQIVTAALDHVAFDGWSDVSLRLAAQDCDIDPKIAMLLFPDTAGDMIATYVRQSDAAMHTRLEEMGFATMKVREKVTACVRARLEIAADHEEATRRAVQTLAQPKYAQLAAKLTWGTADEIWNACGDTATDYNHYTKRAILSGVYSSTLLYWLQDKSEGKVDSWAFLDRRIAGVMRFEKVKAQVLKVQDSLPDLPRFFGRLRYPARP